MRQGIDLIRRMVLAIEDHPQGYAPDDLGIEGYTADQIGYHAYLIVSRGWAAGADATSGENTGPFYEIFHLTPAGHDFAESVRNQFVWDEVRNEIKAKGLVSATLDVVKRMLGKRLRKHLDAE